MFGRKRRHDEGDDRHGAHVPADATVVSATFVQSVDEWNMALFDFTVDVTPDGGEPFRQTTRQKAIADQHPKLGDTLRVELDPDSHDVVLDLDDDPRYRPQPLEEAEAFNQRYAANLDEVTHLEQTGKHAPAVIHEVTECGWQRSVGQTEFAVVAEVSPTGGSPFTSPVLDLRRVRDEHADGRPGHRGGVRRRRSPDGPRRHLLEPAGPRALRRRGRARPGGRALERAGRVPQLRGAGRPGAGSPSPPIPPAPCATTPCRASPHEAGRRGRLRRPNPPPHPTHTRVTRGVAPTVRSPARRSCRRHRSRKASP